MSDTVFDDPPKDIVELLRRADPYIADGALIKHLLIQAADTIERLRSVAGKADVGPSFAEIARDLPRNEPVNA